MVNAAVKHLHRRDDDRCACHCQSCLCAPDKQSPLWEEEATWWMTVKGEEEISSEPELSPDHVAGVCLSAIYTAHCQLDRLSGKYLKPGRHRACRAPILEQPPESELQLLCCPAQSNEVLHLVISRRCYISTKDIIEIYLLVCGVMAQQKG